MQMETVPFASVPFACLRTIEIAENFSREQTMPLKIKVFTSYLEFHLCLNLNDYGFLHTY